MMRYLAFIVFCTLAFVDIPAYATSQQCNPPNLTTGCTMVGLQCSRVGETRLDNDQKRIIACLCINIPNCDTTNNLGDLKWK